MSDYKVIVGDCIEVLKTLDDNSIDAMVTDPPAGVSFMGKKWDDDKGGRRQWVAWLAEIMGEALRVLKPGAHAVVWSLPRTSHWTGWALEDAGFEIRDCGQVFHAFGSGFPKSHNVSIALDAMAGAEREVVQSSNGGIACSTWREHGGVGFKSEFDITAPATPEAKQWQGWGTALKPAYEGWWLVRKPLEGTIAANVLKCGVGALNVDGCRVGDDGGTAGCTAGPSARVFGNGLNGKFGSPVPGLGRWPPNILLMHAEDCTESRCVTGCAAQTIREQGGDPEFFPCFYQAKPSREEREAGLEGLPLRSAKKWNEGGIQGRRDEQANKAIADAEIHSQGLDARGRTLIREDGSKTLVDRFIPQHRANIHPTVKPIELMRWLARLVTPPGGKVIDPFTGSGTTGCACAYEGFEFLGIEREAEYAEIARARIAWHQIAATRAIDAKEEHVGGKPAQLGLFGGAA